MHITENIGGCLPTQKQLELIKICLSESPNVAAAWGEWKKESNLESIDDSVFRLLPMLYYTLQRASADDPDMQKLKGIYKRNLFCNQMLFHSVERVLGVLHAKNIPTILLKGVALSYVYYPDPYTRAMVDGDVLIPLDRVDEAIDLLLENGWQIKAHSHAHVVKTMPLKKNYKQSSHACTFVDPKGYELDLHWRLFPEYCDDGVFWQRAVPLMFRSQPTLTLSHTDHLFHTCMHGYRWNLLHPMRWIVDAHMIVKKAGDQILWPSLLEEAKKREVSLRLFKSLEFLQKECDIHIPASVLEDLQKIPFSQFEHFEYAVVTKEKYMTIEPKSVILWHFKRIWCAHRRLYPSSSLLLQFFTYPTTLANEFNLASLWQLPLLLFRITIKRFRYMISDRFAMFFFMLITLFSVLSYSPLATALNNSDDGISVDDFRVLNREQLLSSINELVSQNKIEEACQLYQYFDCLLVDESIIEHSNGLIDKLRETGRQIIATTDPLREPKDNELVIVYGNYHHAHNNLPYSNKIWRHPLYFKDLKHSKFEYDPAWESIGVVYILNLEERVDRYMEILSELCRVRAPLNRICHYKVKRESITGDKSFDAHASCTKNHGNMVEDFLKGIHQTCLILEDDVTFTADIEGNLKRLKLFFDRQYDYEVCLLNSSKYHEIKEYDDLLLLSYQECTTCSAYLLNRKGAEKVLFYFRDGYEKLIKLRTTHYVCDRYWAEMQKNNKFFLFKTKFGYQRCSFSSTTGNTECHFD